MTRRHEEAQLARWVEANVGGRVVRIQRLARWRPAWDVDVEMDGRTIPLHARGERESNFAIPRRIADEVPIHDLLEAHGIPVPHVYGLCDAPYALVMDRLAGDVDLTFAASDEERQRLIHDYLTILPTIYGIGLDEAAAAGFSLPDGAVEVALGSFRNYEREHDALLSQRDPVAAYLRGWLHRNVPMHRTEAAFVTYDAFQFLFDNGRITGLLDFELACVGDPMMDLAALRVRDTIKNLGDLSAIADQFEAITGIAVDHDAVDYHTVLYNTLTVLTAAPPLAAPERTADYVSHLAWYVNSARWAFEAIADIDGFALEPVAVPRPTPSPHAAAFGHLASVLRARSAEGGGDYEAATVARLARHVRLVDATGGALLADDLTDLEVLLGHRPSPETADAELLAVIDEAGADRDEALVRLLDRRMQRAHLLLGPPGSLILRHPRLRDLRPGSDAAPAEDQRWPAGAIPGT